MRSDQRHAVAKRIADTHWITTFGGTRCVGCEWWQPRHGEDVSAAARRHVAEVALEEALDARDENYDQTKIELTDALAERNELNEKLNGIESLAGVWRLSRNVARQQDADDLLSVLDDSQRRHE